MKKFKRIFCLIPALLLALAIPAAADTIRLKDGGIIKGKVVGFNGGSFVVVIGEGSRQREMRFAASDVESIHFETSAPSGGTTSVPVNRPSSTASARGNEAAPPTRPVARATPNPAVVRTSDNTVSSQPRVQTSTHRSQPSAPGPVTPVELRVKVLADNTANGWTNSGWVVRKGQRIRITAADDTVNLGGGRMAPPYGLNTEDPQKLMQHFPTGALIAVIGDDNNDFIYIGSEREFTATRDGALYLGINEGNLSDNSGAFDVRIEIFPESS